MNGLLFPASGCVALRGDWAGAAGECIACIGMGLSSGIVGVCACMLGSETVGRAACCWPYSARMDALS